MGSLELESERILKSLGLGRTLSGVFDGRSWEAHGPTLEVRTPIDRSLLARVQGASPEDYERVIQSALAAFERWREVPPPRRGAIVREIADEVRAQKRDLGRLVSLEVGKIVAEGEGEVQEMIDIADFAVGLSRQLYGFTMTSERPSHRMYEQWHPLGIVGCITAFNFPIAVWSWNAMIALVCGDVCVWKPSSQAPLSACAVVQIASQVLSRHGYEGVLSLLVGRGESVGERIASDPRIPLVSATGSCEMGEKLARTVSSRLGRTILELGGNNAILVTPSADLTLAVRAILFAAVGTAGQRCTTARRLIVHESVAERLLSMLERAYAQVRLGNPLEEGVLMGPLIDERAVESMMKALEEARSQGGKIRFGGKRREDLGPTYVEPTIVEISPEAPIVLRETFAPILWVHRYRGDVREAIRIQNSVPQGLSSSIFTLDLREAEIFLSASGSDCGIANVNVGTSGAEIGGAFGGEKKTGGGREAGSDSWKAYMRRQTVTINYSPDLPLSQGIRFDVS